MRLRDSILNGLYEPTDDISIAGFFFLILSYTCLVNGKVISRSRSWSIYITK